MASLPTSELAMQLSIDKESIREESNFCPGDKPATLASGSSLLNLPTEIKLKIVRYSVVFNNGDDNTTELVKVRGGRPDPSKKPLLDLGLFRVCREYRDLGMEVFYSSHVFSIDCPRFACSVLPLSDGRQWVRAISLRHTSHLCHLCGDSKSLGSYFSVSQMSTIKMFPRLEYVVLPRMKGVHVRLTVLTIFPYLPNLKVLYYTKGGGRWADNYADIIKAEGPTRWAMIRVRMDLDDLTWDDGAFRRLTDIAHRGISVLL